MSVASPTEDLVPFHPVAVIAFTSDIFLSDWLPEARPSCSRFKLGFSGEQIIAATDAFIDPSLVIIPIFAGEARSVPFFRVTSYCSRVSCCFHSASVLTTFSLIKNRSEERRVGKECRSRWSRY